MSIPRYAIQALLFAQLAFCAVVVHGETRYLEHSGQNAGASRMEMEALAAVDAPAVAHISGAIRPGVALMLNLALAGANVRLDLQPISYRAPDFKLEVIENGQSRFVDPGPARTVRGVIADLPGSRILGVVKPSGLELTITLPDGKILELAPLARSGEKADRRLYTIIPSGQIDRSAVDAEAEKLSDELAFAKSTGENCASIGLCGAKIIFDTDYPFFQFNGSSNAQAMATVDGVLLQVNQRFAVLKIRQELSMVRLRVDAASDPYDDPSISTSADLRDAIHDEWIATTSGYDVDLVHLLAGRTVPGTGGESPIAGICSSHKYTFSRVVGSDCSSAVITTHELGHNWGSYHSQGIMANASASCSATWDAQSTTWIAATRDVIDSICLDLIPPKRARIFDLSLPSTMVAGQTYPVSVKLENTGVLTWSPVGAISGAYRLAQVGSVGWQPIRVDLPAALAVGQMVTLNFNVTAPLAGGVLNFQLQMVHENVEFFGDPSANVPVTVLVKNALISQPIVPTTMVAGGTYPVSLTVQNTGSVAWSPIGPSCNAYRLGSVGSAGWNPVRVDFPAALNAGNQATLNFNVIAPASAGIYTFQWQMVHECVEWFGSQSPAVSVTVTP